MKECESRGVLQEMFDLAVYFTPVSLATYNEEYQKALDYISHTGWEGHFCTIQYQPRGLFQAQLYRWMNLPDIAETCYDSALMILETALQENDEDHRIMASIGIAFAGLGNKKRAIEFGKRAYNLYSFEKDAFGGLYRVADLAYIYVLLEDYDNALEQLEILLSKPGPYSAALLKLDPVWKPLWDHPDFIRLTEKYAKKGNKNYDS